MLTFIYVIDLLTLKDDLNLGTATQYGQLYKIYMHGIYMGLPLVQSCGQCKSKCFGQYILPLTVRDIHFDYRSGGIEKPRCGGVGCACHRRHIHQCKK